MANDAPDVRTLSFPPDRSIGQLHRPDHKYEDAIWFNWELIGNAQGQVAVPADTRLRLDVGDLTAGDAAALLTLPAGLILQLRVGRAVEADALSAVLDHHRVEQLGLSGPMTDSVARVVGRADTVRHLLPATGIATEHLAAIAASPSIESLQIGGPNLTDEGMRHVASMTRLRTLIISIADVGDAGIAHLAKHPTLESFSGWSVDVSDQGVAALATVPNLRVLELSTMHHVSDEGIAHLAGMKHLHTVRLDNTRVTAKGLAVLADLPNLRRLTAPPTMDNAAIDAVLRMRRIEYLHLGMCSADEAKLAELASLSSLTELNLGGEHLTDSVVAALAKLPNLRSLWLQNAPVTDAGLAALAEDADLEQLMLFNLPVTAQGIMALAKMRSLNNLSIYPQRGSESIGLAGLENFSALKWFTMRAGVTDEDLKSIARLTQLERLDIGGDITDDGLARLRGMPNLWQLSLQQSKLTDDGLRHLASLPRLRNLSIGGNITDFGVAHVKNVPTLEGVYFASRTISEQALDDLRNALPLHPIVQKAPGQPVGPAPRVGDMAPDFELELVNGQAFRLTDQRGKAVLLYFWATWCSPCVVNTEDLKALHAELAQTHGDRFIMLSLAQCVQPHDTRRHVERHGLAWPQAHIGLGAALAARYGVSGAPFYYVIGPDGRIASDSRDWNAIRRAIAESLADAGQ